MKQMNFLQTTDRLFAHLTHVDLAEALGVSVASIKQARVKPEASGYRSPPPGWEAAVLKLSEAQARHYQKLIADLRRTRVA